ncbi:MAG: hypothetical protein GC165_11510 [Armatimonadetes bacterium]|nr:hypothetical protein [Armatimonadota bacterium]
MPIIYGIAAMAALSNGCDMEGIDPQIDRQYAIVKQAEVPATTTSTVDTSINESSFAPRKAEEVCPVGSFATGQATMSFSIQGGSTNGDTISVTASPSTFLPGTTTNIATTQYTVAGQNPNNRIITTRAIGAGSLQSLKGMDRKVSVKFENASAGDVLKWLGKQNVNFVANLDQLPKSKITMNLKDVPLSEALESVADALGGSWHVKGSTIIFGHGGFFSGNGLMMGPNNFFQWSDKDMKGLTIDPKVFQFDNKALRGMQIDPKVFQFDGKALKGLDGKAFQFDSSKWKDMTIDPKVFQFDGKNLKGMDGKTFEFDGKAFKELKDMKTFKGAMTFKKIDAAKFLKSLSSAQKETMKKQGYLKISDLTDEQKGMLFNDPKGEMPKSITITLSDGDNSVTIKN